MEAIIQVKNLSFSYANEDPWTLRDISFEVQTGEFVLICGKSGCGKSTLLRHLKPELTPSGHMHGEVIINGVVGFVMQNPDSQIVTDKVWHELAFGLENQGVSSDEIRLRVAEMASYFGIQNWFHKSVKELSGGQKQLLNLAAIMVMQPDILVLDEPTSQLDPIAAADFLNTICKINRELGTTIIMTEHRLEEIYEHASSVIVMDTAQGYGEILCKSDTRAVAKELRNNPLFLSLPVPTQAHGFTKDDSIIPLNIEQGRRWLSDLVKDMPDSPKKKEAFNRDEDTVLSLSDIYFRYEKNEPDVLKGLSLEVKRGDIYCLLGGNGAGKTTAISIITGMNKAQRGRVKHWIAPKDVAIVPQEPMSMFSEKTVRDEICDNQELAALTHIEHLLNRHPYDLSAGEQQRLAIAKALLSDPTLLLLDEPTKGMDNFFKEELGQIFAALIKEGKTIFMISHDIEFCATNATACALMFDGKIVTESSPRQFFLGNTFYTTAANRMARHIYPDVVTLKDLLEKIAPDKSWETKLEKLRKDTMGQKEYEHQKEDVGQKDAAAQENVKHPQKIKHGSRYLMVITVLTAIAVVGRLAFFMVPQFKPVAAICMIAGFSLGKRAGLTVGVLSAFVSNFYFGQGPWTLFQMLALGLIGGVAGAFAKSKLRWNRLFVGGLGFVLTYLFYGGITNVSTAILSTGGLSLGAYLGALAVAVPFDVIHSLSTAVFLLIGARPLLDKLERVKRRLYRE